MIRTNVFEAVRCIKNNQIILLAKCTSGCSYFKGLVKSRGMDVNKVVEIDCIYDRKEIT